MVAAVTEFQCEISPVERSGRPLGLLIAHTETEVRPGQIYQARLEQSVKV